MVEPVQHRMDLVRRRIGVQRLDEQEAAISGDVSSYE